MNFLTRSLRRSQSFLCCFNRQHVWNGIHPHRSPKEPPTKSLDLVAQLGKGWCLEWWVPIKDHLPTIGNFQGQTASFGEGIPIIPREDRIMMQIRCWHFHQTQPDLLLDLNQGARNSTLSEIISKLYPWKIDAWEDDVFFVLLVTSCYFQERAVRLIPIFPQEVQPLMKSGCTFIYQHPN